MILDTIQNLSLIMTDFQLRFFWFAYLSTMSKASFPLFILILLFLLKCGNIFTYWAPEAAVFLSSKNMNLHFTFKLMWQLQLLRFHLWDQHLSSKRNFIIYQNALETLEPAVNHQRAAHVGSSDHFPPPEWRRRSRTATAARWPAGQRLLTSPKTSQQIYKQALFG